MFRLGLDKKGQSIFEYAIIIGIIGTALIAMQTYLRRGIQCGIQIAADELGQQDILHNREYENYEEETPAIPRYYGSKTYSEVETSNYVHRIDSLQGNSTTQQVVADTTIRQSPEGPGGRSSISFSSWLEE